MRSYDNGVLDVHYQDPRLAEIYDLDSPWSVDRDFYLALAGEPPQNILDLGCGTGLLCDAYAARNHMVTGVDPAKAMLGVARRKPHGDKIEWVETSAQAFSSEKRYNLIIMTGHAFQVLLDETDARQTFAVMRKHLAPSGRIVFESRNPNIDWAQVWNYEMAIELSNCTVAESRRFVAMQGARMTFELKYQFPTEVLLSTSELRFWQRDEIEKHLAECGLSVEKFFGNWDESPFDEKESPEMIFVARAV
jgi:predicted TPR repeat methyltransferase